MNHLKEIINNSYSTLPKSQVLQITLDVCYQQMKKTSEKARSINSDTVLNLQKVDLYSKINDGLLEFTDGSRNFEKINTAKNSIDILNKLIENETLNDLENGTPSKQEDIINNSIVPHYLIEWTLNNL